MTSRMKNLESYVVSSTLGRVPISISKYQPNIVFLCATWHEPISPLILASSPNTYQYTENPRAVISTRSDMVVVYSWLQKERMDAAAISQLKTIHQFCVFTPKIGVSCPPPIVSLPVQDYQLKKRVILRCGGQVTRIKCAKEADKISSMEKELNMEEELIGMKKLNEKCKEIGGIVELMECLEREAIMGEDEGREPTDYNRRALIFDKSSRVFQALKQQAASASFSA